jgi:hypothetical protein
MPQPLGTGKPPDLPTDSGHSLQSEHLTGWLARRSRRTRLRSGFPSAACVIRRPHPEPDGPASRQQVDNAAPLSRLEEALVDQRLGYNPHLMQEIPPAVRLQRPRHLGRADRLLRPTCSGKLQDPRPDRTASWLCGTHVSAPPGWNIAETLAPPSREPHCPHQRTRR